MKRLRDVAAKSKLKLCLLYTSQANGGTLLLDEISAMPYELQSKLLRVLQEDYIRRVGGTTDIPIDVRILSLIHI